MGIQKPELQEDSVASEGLTPLSRGLIPVASCVIESSI